MKRWIMLLPVLFCASILAAQDESYSTKGNLYFTEASFRLTPHDKEWKTLSQPVTVSFASSNSRYTKDKVPQVQILKNWNTSAWKGEKVHTQLLVWTNQRLPQVSFSLGKLVNEKGQTISTEHIRAGFVRYVITDEFAGGCGYRKPQDFDSSLVADAIDITPSIPVPEQTVQPVWLSVHVPQQAATGLYKGT
ncbi:MAG: hypothetical protein IT250_08055, partial [Chitinophagaceae bacterium]|nr:hypothetical protein [Chitinophagaceae bacterium]